MTLQVTITEPSMRNRNPIITGIWALLRLIQQ